MADPIIELQELLNRAAGPGKIGPDSPLETRLYGANGQPIGTAGNPLQVKAHDTDAALGQIKDALGPLATETKLEAVRTLLAAIAEKDFATQGTLAQVKQALDTLNGLVSTSAGQTAIADAIQTLSDVVATQQTLAQAVTQLTNIVNKLNSTLTVDGKVELKGSKARISSEPVVGVRTVTSIAAELHAGAIRKAGRSLLMVRNLDPDVRVRVGPSVVSDRTGFGIEPEAVLTLAIDPGSDVPIYAVSEAGAVQVEVFEA